jgi:hypothetical protein
MINPLFPYKAYSLCFVLVSSLACRRKPASFIQCTIEKVVAQVKKVSDSFRSEKTRKPDFDLLLSGGLSAIIKPNGVCLVQTHEQKENKQSKEM